jgi:hypothetical protein
MNERHYLLARAKSLRHKAMSLRAEADAYRLHPELRAEKRAELAAHYEALAASTFDMADEFESEAREAV